MTAPAARSAPGSPPTAHLRGSRPSFSASPGLSTFGLRAAGALGMTGVMLGAFGAHALRGRISPEMLEVYKTGVSYHLWHALGLLGISLLVDRLRWPRATLALFIGGVVVFSGTLYLLAISGARWLGAITPLGGLSLIAGWATLIASHGADPAPRPPSAP